MVWPAAKKPAKEDEVAAKVNWKEHNYIATGFTCGHLGCMSIQCHICCDEAPSYCNPLKKIAF